MDKFRALFEVPYWKNYSLALIALLLSAFFVVINKLTGAEWLMALGAVGTIFGAADVTGKWVTRAKPDAATPIP